jgi:ribosomal protein S18 acetylase RimI-like enzyme
MASSDTAIRGRNARGEGIVLRRARFDEAAELDLLDRSVWDETTTPAGPRKNPFFGAKQQLADTWVADDGGLIVGFFVLGQRTTLESNRHVALLRMVAVAAEHRGRGIGTALVRRAIEESNRRRCQKLSLTVLGTNARAIRLYEREGFAVEGRLTAEFLLGGAWVDDIVMARVLCK